MRKYIPYLFTAVLAISLALVVAVWALKPDDQVRALIGGQEFLLEVADSSLERAVGLQGRKFLAPQAGMLFAFDEPAIQSFWMKNTLIPLDLLWVAGGEVVGVTTDVQPQPGVATGELTLYPSPQPVSTVIEINAGAVEEFGIEVGDEVVLQAR